MAKLGIEEDENLKVFLEDGTVIEDENVLMCDWLQKEVLYIGKDMINLNMNQNKLDQIKKFLGGSGSASDNTPRKGTAEFDENSSYATPSGASSSSGKEFNRGALVLPDFTAPVRDAMESDKANEVWSQMINQLGDFYRKYFPERFHSSEDYRWVGTEMYKKYPSISRLGMNPWSALTHSLSCKMRSLRHSAKKKLDNTDTGDEPPKKKSRSNSCEIVNALQGASNDDNLLDKEDYVKHKKEMKEIVSKGGAFSTHGKFLLRKTFGNRQKEKDEMGQDVNVMQKIVKMAPVIFAHPDYLMYEFVFMKQLSDKEKEDLYVRVGEILEKILAKKQPSYEGEELNKAMAFRHLEKEIGFRKGKGGKYKNIVQTLWDIDDDRIEEKCVTEENEAPKLLVFIKNEDVSMTCIVGDTLQLNMNSCDVINGLVHLMASYYVFDIGYPRCYSQSLGLMQEVVMNEKFKSSKTNKFNEWCTYLKK